MSHVTWQLVISRGLKPCTQDCLFVCVTWTLNLVTLVICKDVSQEWSSWIKQLECSSLKKMYIHRQTNMTENNTLSSQPGSLLLGGSVHLLICHQLRKHNDQRIIRL